MRRAVFAAFAVLMFSVPGLAQDQCQDYKAEIARLKEQLARCSGTPAGAKAGALPMVVRQEGFSIELRSCSLQGDVLDCQLMATAEAEDTSLRLNSWSRLVESDGTEMLASRIQLGKDEARGQSYDVRVELVRGVPVKMGVSFAGLNPSVSGKEVRLIELSLSGFKAQFQHVPVNQP